MVTPVLPNRGVPDILGALCLHFRRPGSKPQTADKGGRCGICESTAGHGTREASSIASRTVNLLKAASPRLGCAANSVSGQLSVVSCCLLAVAPHFGPATPLSPTGQPLWTGIFEQAKPRPRQLTTDQSPQREEPGRANVDFLDHEERVGVRITSAYSQSLFRGFWKNYSKVHSPSYSQLSVVPIRGRAPGLSEMDTAPAVSVK